MRNVLMWLLMGTLVTVLTASGLAFTGFGVHFALTPKIPGEFTATTSVTIREFRNAFSNRSATRYAEFSYAVNGVEYFYGRLSDPDDALRIGDTVQIRYDTRDPEIIEWADAWVGKRIIGGAVISAIGLALLAFVGWIIRQIRARR
jgi:hypothetical protein